MEDFGTYDVSTGVLDISNTWSGLFDDADFMYYLVNALDEKLEFFQFMMTYHLTESRECKKTYTTGHKYSDITMGCLAQEVSDSIIVYGDELINIDLIIKQYTHNIESGLSFRLLRGQFHVCFLNELRNYEKGEYFVNSVMNNLKTYLPGVFRADTDRTINTMLSAVQVLNVLKKIVSEFPFVVSVTKMQ